MRNDLFIKLFGIVYIVLIFLICQIASADQSNKIALLKEMFNKVAVQKNDKLIPLYYDKEFELYSNGKKMKYDEFSQMHRNIYQTAIQYKVRYDEETFVEHGNKVAGRLFITTRNPGEPAHEIEVILIAEYKNNKLYRLWELTYPDWSKLKAFSKRLG